MDIWAYESRALNGNKIDISSDTWEELNSNFDKVTIKQFISDLIAKHDLPLPYSEVTLEEAKESFKQLQGMDCTALIQSTDFFTRYEYENELSGVIINQSNVGNKSSNFFHQENRWLCDSINSPSPYRSWTMERFRLTLFNALWTLKFKSINSTTLRTAIALRKYSVSI